MTTKSDASASRSAKNSTSGSKPKVVVDTNVFVSGCLGGDNGGKVIDALRRQAFQLVISDRLLDELRQVFARPRFTQDREFRKRSKQALSVIAARALRAKVHTRIEVCRDPKDNAVLEAAVAGGAKVIVSGDKDLLGLHPYEGIEIIPPAVFVRRLDATAF